LIPANQIHDFNPGFVPNGLFWTIRIPDDSVAIDLDEAVASMDLSDLEIRDFFTLTNALSGGKSIPAVVSFDINWSGVINRVKVSDETNQFTGNYIEDTATISWSAQESGFTFVSDPANTSTTVFAEIGKERNGFFFHGG
jgi:hypothetical protein